MGYIISNKSSFKKTIFHTENCPYAKKIEDNNHKTVLKKLKSKTRTLCACKYCGGIRKDMADAVAISKNTKFTYYCDISKNCIYVDTGIGNWKIKKDEYDLYQLWHMNNYKKDMKISEIKRDRFHRQRDFSERNSLVSILNYIVRHDNAKVIIKDDYRKLPQHTKKQKAYYKIAKNKDRRKSARRVDKLFMLIEKQSPDIRQYAYC